MRCDGTMPRRKRLLNRDRWPAKPVVVPRTFRPRRPVLGQQPPQGDHNPQVGFTISGPEASTAAASSSSPVPRTSTAPAARRGPARLDLVERIKASLQEQEQEQEEAGCGCLGPSGQLTGMLGCARKTEPRRAEGKSNDIHV